MQASIGNYIKEYTCVHHIASFSLRVSSYLFHILFSQKEENPMGSVEALHEPSPVPFYYFSLQKYGYHGACISHPHASFSSVYVFNVFSE